MLKTLREYLRWFWLCIALWMVMALGAVLWTRMQVLNPVSEEHLSTMIQSQLPVGSSSQQVKAWCKSQKFVNTTLDIDETPIQDTVIIKSLKRSHKLKQIINFTIPRTTLSESSKTTIQFYIDKNETLMDFVVHQYSGMP